MTADLSSDTEIQRGTSAGTKAKGRPASAGARVAVAAVCLVISDLAAAALTGEIARVGLSALVEGPVAGLALRLLAVAVAVQLLLKAIFGLFPGFGLHPEARLRKASLAWGAAAFIAGVSGAVFGGAVIGPLALMLPVFAAVALAQGGGRLLVMRTLRRRVLWGLPVQVLGDPEAVPETIGFLRQHPAYGFMPVQEATDRPSTGATLALWAGREMPEDATLRWLRRSYAEILLLSDLPGVPLNGVHPAEHGGTLGLRLTGTARRPAMPLSKRLFDLTIAGPCAIIAAPVIALAALMIRKADPGSAFYTQPRDGLKGRQIGVLKLRTMYRDADKMLETLLASDPAARAEWEAHFKLRQDPRILPVAGRLLRATSLDELPQLWNILRGDMSLVGPRPFPSYHLDAMSPEFRRRRATLVPGLTGLWQISDRSDGDLARQEALDGYYIDNRSFWLDLSILLRTFSAVLSGRGAY